MTDNAVREIQAIKGATMFPEKFIRYFEEEWSNAVDAIRSTGADLTRILIVKK